MSSMGRAELGAPTGSSSFHLIGFPILHEGNLVAVPLVDPVVEAVAGGGWFLSPGWCTRPSPCVALSIFPSPAPVWWVRPPNRSPRSPPHAHSPHPALPRSA